MSSNYPFRSVEKKWQEYWLKYNSFNVMDYDTSSKAYILEMLPYPSGRIHMGHVRNYAIGDAIARFYKAKGFRVLHPMGWDAFGLPAENAALERKVHPKTWTYQNINDMKEQLMSLGLSYDWGRELATCGPEYYGLEQEIFLDFYDSGLVYRKESMVNWDPVENTVLANEQVINGRGWRSNAVVERKNLTQWSIKITNYAQELLDDLKKLNGWPEKVLKMQENWIGRSEGASVNFTVEGRTEELEIYTTRPETLFGASFIAIAPQHPLAQVLNNPELKAFIDKCSKTVSTEEAISTIEKKGFNTGLFAIHPLSKNIKIPIYVANFVVIDYGAGALFGCPAHDARDFEFANLYNLPILRVVESAQPLPYTDLEGKMINSDFLNGLSVSDAKEKIIQTLETNKVGKRKINFRLRDWLVSRQRYWGCPIPIIHCSTCGVVKVPKDQLPIKLPEDVTFDQPGNPLDRHPTWKHVNCPQCKSKAVRDTDTLDTFFESSWYFMRYCCPNSKTPIDKDICESWLPVDWYIGGVEHAVLHLLYARFFTKALRDCGYLNVDEPFINLLTQGMVCHATYKDKDNQWLYPTEVEKNEHGQTVKISDQSTVTVGRTEKMSKSKRNLVDPQSIIDSYGADAARLFILSDTPPDRDFEWGEEGLDGAWRYLNRLWRLFQEKLLTYNQLNGEKDLQLRKLTHQTLSKITQAYEQNSFNKAIALCRELTRHIEDHLNNCSTTVIREASQILLQTLAPIVPHLTCEVWHQMEYEKKINDWTDADTNLAAMEEVNIAVQINGKFRGVFITSADSSEANLETMAMSLPAIQKFIEGKVIKKVIIVPNRLVNFLIG